MIEFWDHSLMLAAACSLGLVATAEAQTHRMSVAAGAIRSQLADCLTAVRYANPLLQFMDARDVEVNQGAGAYSMTLQLDTPLEGARHEVDFELQPHGRLDMECRGFVPVAPALREGVWDRLLVSWQQIAAHPATLESEGVAGDVSATQCVALELHRGWVARVELSVEDDRDPDGTDGIAYHVTSRADSFVLPCEVPEWR